MVTQKQTEQEQQINRLNMIIGSLIEEVNAKNKRIADLEEGM